MEIVKWTIIPPNIQGYEPSTTGPLCLIVVSKWYIEVEPRTHQELWNWPLTGSGIVVIFFSVEMKNILEIARCRVRFTFTTLLALEYIACFLSMGMSQSFLLKTPWLNSVFHIYMFLSTMPFQALHFQGFCALHLEVYEGYFKSLYCTILPIEVCNSGGMTHFKTTLYIRQY